MLQTQGRNPQAARPAITNLPHFGHRSSRKQAGTTNFGAIRPKLAVRPPSADLATLRRQASIYRQGKTPVVDGEGNLQAWDITPASAEVTAGHLNEVLGRFGDEGLARSVRGLAITRGADFAGEAMRRASVTIQKKVTPAQASAADQESLVGSYPSVDALALASILGVDPGKALPVGERARLAQLSGHSLSDVRIHDDRASHRAARMLNARAFTVGSSIYFGENEYQPTSTAGRRLLAHEVAHAVQQKGAFLRRSDLQVSVPDSAEEQEAERFADTAIGKEDAVPRLSSGCAGAARVMRQISFTHSNHRFTRLQTEVTENATDFDIAPRGADEHFVWLADITINGSPGDPFGAWEIGPLQVVRDWKVNVFYGHGASQTVRRGRATVPARDEVPGRGGVWYDTRLVARGFGASGDHRLGDMEDSPGVDGVEFANPAPKPGAGTGGRFEFVQASVAYLSARDTRAAGAASYQHVAHVWWRIGMSGVFDSALPRNSRIIRTGGGRPTRGNVISGTSSQFPPIHGGPAAADTVTWDPPE